jgi:hypothetical protein
VLSDYGIDYPDVGKGLAMNEDLSELEAVFRKLGVRCACVVLKDGQMLDIDCCGRCRDESPR